MKKLLLWVQFLLFFSKELVLSNIRVAKDVMRRHPKFEPALVAVPVNLKSDFALMVLANTITLTPGTLSVDISRERGVIYIHTIYLDGSREAFVKNIQENFERRVGELFSC